QLVYGGKAHPHDDAGKALIRRIFEVKAELGEKIRLAYLEDYDMRLARLITAGVDLWLNTPQPPLEASGTSGMKAAINGVPSLSTLDGWWVEGCIEGVTGWAIGDDAGVESDADRAADAALPAALRRLGIDARVVMPGYRSVRKAMPDSARRDLPAVEAIAECGVTRLIDAVLPSGVPVIVVEHPSLYDRPGGPYQSESGEDWPDNALRFGLLSKVAAILAGASSPLGWRPDILHCHDWQTGLAPAYLRFAAPAERCGTVFTIHNLAYQGAWSAEWVARLELPAESYSSEGIEFHGRLSFLKAALYYSDAITTVSPTYAREIQSEALGFGLDGLLRWRH